LVDEIVDKPPSGLVLTGLRLASTDRGALPGRGEARRSVVPTGYPSAGSSRRSTAGYSHVIEQEGEPSMDPRIASARAQPTEFESDDPEAIDFVRFCYRRRHVGWPELYDEMCAVAGRGLYRGFAADDLGRIGIGFALDQMPALATIVHQVVAEDRERRRLTADAVRVSYVETSAEVTSIEGDDAPVAPTATTDRIATDASPTETSPRLVAVGAGA
jgi:hypothetical protein